MRRKLINLFRSRNFSAKRPCGFTISEVVVASGLLITAMIPILRGLTAAHLNSSRIAQKSHCLTLAQAKLDEIKARTIYAYLGSYNEIDTVLEGSYLCDVVDVPLGANLRRITVAVGFDTDGNGMLVAAETQVLLDTLVSKRL